MKRVSSGTDIFLDLLLQNIFASEYWLLLATEIHTQPGNSEEESNGIFTAAKPKSCSVTAPPADVLEGTSCFRDGFYSSICSFTLPASCLKGDDQKYNHFMFQNLDVVEKSLKIARRDILCPN